MTPSLFFLISLSILISTVSAKPVYPIKREQNMSFKKFMNEYVHKQIPVIITDYKHVFKNASEHVLKICGEKQAKVAYTNGTGWASVNRELDSKRVNDFLEDCGDNCYGLFDWPLPSNCPEFMKYWTTPKYFAQDLFQRVNKKIRYRESWPSFFIGHDGKHGGLHIDVGNTAFWMYVMSGVKEWRVLSPGKIDPPDLFEQKLYAMNVYPGELIYIPNGCPHQVSNKGLTMAFAGNILLDMQGVREVVSPGKGSYYRQMQQEMLIPSFDSQVQYELEDDLSWDLYKGQGVAFETVVNFHIISMRENRLMEMFNRIDNLKVPENFVVMAKHFPAINGTEVWDYAPAIPYKNWKGECPFENKASAGCMYYTRDITKGELGCTLSHLGALANTQNDPAHINIIVEDDVHFDEDALFKLRNVWHELPDDWDMLYLARHKLEVDTPYSENLVKPGRSWGGWAIVYSEKGVSQILRKTHRIMDNLIAWDEILPAMQGNHFRQDITDLYMDKVDQPLNAFALKENVARVYYNEDFIHDTDK